MDHQIYLYLVSFVLGTCLGSFYNVCIYRYIEQESIVHPPSHCPNCGHYLKWWENIPILSYIFLRGRCSSCGSSISIRYLVVELLSGIWSVLLVIKYGFSVSYFIFLGIGGIFIILSFIDLEIFILPDILTIPGSILCLLSAPLIGVSIINSLIGALFGSGFFLLIQKGYKFLKGREGLGTGDIKLMFMIGALLGGEAIPFVVFLGSIFGLIGGLIFLRSHSQDTSNPIPFGPFLCASAMVYILIGRDLLNWYLKFIR